jgi:hypothetical protein
MDDRPEVDPTVAVACPAMALVCENSPRKSDPFLDACSERSYRGVV